MGSLKEDYKNYFSKILNSSGIVKLNNIINSLENNSSFDFNTFIDMLYQDLISVHATYDEILVNIENNNSKLVDPNLYKPRIMIGDYILQTYINRNDIPSYASQENLQNDIKYIADKYLKLPSYITGDIPLFNLDGTESGDYFIQPLSIFRINNEPSILEKNPLFFKNLMNNDNIRENFIKYVDAVRRGTINY